MIVKPYSNEEIAEFERAPTSAAVHAHRWLATLDAERAESAALLQKCLDAMNPMTDPWMPDATRELLAEVRAALARMGGG